MKVLFITLFLLVSTLQISAQITLLETTEANIVTYHPGHKYLLNHAARSFHNTLDFQKKLWGYEPTEKISVFIEDFGDFGNGGATSVPRNFISFGISPFSYAFETSPAGERVFATLNHEMVHVAALDNSTQRDRFFQKVFFGKVEPTSEHPISLLYAYLTSPRYYAPRWYHEGIAAYMETWMGGGVGLGLGNWDEMNFRTKVADNEIIYTAKGISTAGTTTDFQGMSNAYLYGARFMGYLSYTYGPESIINWVKRDEGSKANYASQFEHIFNNKIQKVWKNWIAFEEDFQTQNIEEISQNPITKFTPYTDKVLGSVSIPFFDKKRNKIYMAVSYPGQISHLAAIDVSSGKIEKLTEVNGAALFYVTSLIFDEEKDKLYFTEDNNVWRDIFEYDLNTKKKKLVFENVRTGDLALNKTDGSIWGVRHSEGLSSLVRIKDDKDRDPFAPVWNQILTLPYGSDIYDIDISPNGKKLSASVSDFRGEHHLLIYNVETLMNKDILNDIDTVPYIDSSPQSFRFSKDGNHLYGSLYYSGVSNIFRVNVRDTEDIEAMSNGVNGFFRPLDLGDSSFFVLKFKAKGFVPGKIPNKVVKNIASIDYLGGITIDKHPQIKDWELSIPKKVDYPDEEIIIDEREYSAKEFLKLNSAYPMIFGYRDHVGVGYNFNFRDLFGLTELNIQMGVSPRSWKNAIYEDRAQTTDLDTDEQFHLSFEYKKIKLPNGTYSIYGSYNHASFYDLLGPRNVSLKGSSLGVSMERNFLQNSIKKLDLQGDFSGFYGLNRSPDFQTIEVAGFDNNFFLNFRNRLSYSNLRASMGAVDYEKGISTSLSALAAYSAGNLYPGVNASLNLGTPFLFKHTSIWLRNFAGYSFSDVFNPFTRFGFAAFGNNYLDYRSSKQYRNPFSLPGLRFDAEETIISKAYFKTMAELSLPPIRFTKLGTYNFFVNWIQPSVFGSVLLSNGQDGDMLTNQAFGNYGFQIDTRLIVLSQQSATLSFGMAQATNFDLNTWYNEWFISLKILKK
ncbi:MAG: hypothetical protein RIA69_16135 [Cyclobacteriaceae bacterium]